MGKLTVRKIESLSEPGRYSDEDGNGFHLRIDPQGRKYFVLRTYVAGRRKDIAIGSAKSMALSTARELARARHDEIKKSGGRRDAEPTFAEAAVQAHKARTSGFRNGKHVAQWLATLETYANPVVGEKLVSQVERADVVKILTPIWLTKPETAGRVLQRIDRVMRWAVGNDYRHDRIDMTLVRDALPPRKRRRADIRRMASVPWQEVPAFWRDLTLSRSSPEVRMGLAALILTAVRPGNIATATRDEVNLATATWTIPADKMKAGVPHRVPLSTAAVKLFERVIALHDHPLLFAVGESPLSPDTLRMAMRRMDRTETPHGFRSSFKDWSRATGWSDELSEIALAHADPNEVRAAYARGDMLEERRPMMEAWAAFLEGQPGSGATPPRG